MNSINFKIPEGTKLHYETVFFDDCDEYIFTINKYASSLKWHFQLNGYDNGTIETHEKALKESTVLISFSSQGTYGSISKETEGDDCPIFLMSKKLYNNLLNQKQSILMINQHGNKKVVEYIDIVKRSIIVNGEEVSVDTIHAVIKDNEDLKKDNLWVLNNPEFPLVLKIETDFVDGDSYFELKEIILGRQIA